MQFCNLAEHHFLYCKPVRHHTINVDTATCVRVQAFNEIHNFAMQAEAA